MTDIEELKAAVEILEKFVSDRSKFGGETIDNAIRQITHAAQELIELREEIKVYDYAFDLCHRYNGNLKSDYFKEARKALVTTPSKGEDDA